MNAVKNQPAVEALESPPSDVQIVRLKTRDGFKPSTTVENATTVPPVRPPRIAFPFEEI